MAFERGAATAVATILLMSGVAWAGFDTGVLITKSPQFEQAVSHVLVGRLNAFHEIKAAPGRYVAEIAVSIVEKGAGVRSGDRIYVRFTSPKSLAQIRTERLVSDCGDRKIDPLPGEWMRIYTRLNEDFEYVADHPSCFFSIGRKDPAEASKSVTDLIDLRAALTITFALVIGFVAGFFVRARGKALTSRPVQARA